MKLKINKNNTNQEKSIKNYALFTDENFILGPLEKTKLSSKVPELNKTIRSYKNTKSDIISFNLNSDQKIIFIKLKKNLSFFEIEQLGAELYEHADKNLINQMSFLKQNISNLRIKDDYFFDYFLMGAQLKSYQFSKYKTKKESKKIEITIEKTTISQNKNNRFNSLVEGTILTKDLVSEPGNILYPEEYSKRILSLKKLGIKIKIYNEREMKKMGMGALLGVGQGSSRQSYLVTMEWNGINKKNKPLAFVGKGVCFDTGGISLKPAKFMEDMTYDMAGSAVVVGLMKNLALRKAKVNAVGVVGLVENMPDGNAQRPGDIVKSYSGQTIEVLNTDAEGRLVLADAITFTEKKFKPKFIIDLATLTGAIIVALGSEYAGLFSNDDKLSKQIYDAGEKVGEKVWRMPLNKNYDKLIESKKADMQNINYVGGAGSTTAAQFLQRFILNKTPWAHLDIAGMAFSKYGGALNSGGATGYGVRLLNQLIEDNYE
ncbi:leucyl aminopeptidase [Candidatus Pelagibacter sp.]|nr:leucyl aminopeptidase [Candidatus Pelagibacter sp.]